MKIKNYLRDPFKYTVLHLADHGKLDRLSDEKYLKLMYRAKFKKKLNLNSPKTFNEKLQWIKLYDRKDIYTTMVDKYEVKKYVADIIGEEYVIPMLGVWDGFEDIDFDALPDKFVLKTTHDSGGIVICRDKAAFDIEKAREKLTKSLAREYFPHGREWPYKNVKHRILAEEYVQDGDNPNLPVFKIFNFGGKPTVIQVIQNDKTKSETIDYFDTGWHRLDLRQNFPNSENPLPKPSSLEVMLSLAERLSDGFPFLRTDFYTVNGEVRFSEFTFFSDSGLAKFHPEEWDKRLGDMIVLPRNKNGWE